MSELDYLSTKIREHMNAVADHMAGGGCQSFDQYQKLCGQIEALAVVEREILDLKEKVEGAE
jgi:hypothetical protein